MPPGHCSNDTTHLNPTLRKKASDHLYDRIDNIGFPNLELNGKACKHCHNRPKKSTHITTVYKANELIVTIKTKRIQK